MLTLAFGPDRYLRQAENLARSLRLHMPRLPIALVTDRRPGPGWNPDRFDHVIPYDPGFGPGIQHKLYVRRYTPFRRTLYIDSDSLVLRDFSSELERLEGHSFCPVGDEYLARGDSDPFIEDLDALFDRLGIDTFPKFNGGLYYFRDDAAAGRLFDEAERLAAQYRALGLRPFRSLGPNDETLVGLAMARLGMRLHDDGGRLMRTPIDLSGTLHVDPFGGARFVKRGVDVAPAICHFCGRHVERPEYRYAVYLQRRPGLRPLRRGVLGLFRLADRLERGWRGLSRLAGGARVKATGAGAGK